MESSIAAFLMRWSACELLPTYITHPREVKSVQRTVTMTDAMPTAKLHKHRCSYFASAGGGPGDPRSITAFTS